MRILIVSPTYPPEVGAAPSRISNMAEGLMKAGAEVDVLGALPNYPKGRIFDGYRRRFSKKDVINGVRVYRYWTYASVSKHPLSRIASMFALATTIWAFAPRASQILKYDYVIVQTPSLPVAASAMAIFKRIYGRKTLLNVSDIWPDTAVELGAMRRGSLPFRVMQWMERYVYKHCDAVQGQSKEILEHIEKFGNEKPAFLYRNLQHTVEREFKPLGRQPFRIAYAGLLGVAQDILGLIKSVDFKALGVEFHLYGSGNQCEEIKSHLTGRDLNVYYHGSLPKQEMVNTLMGYNASIVPLTVRIHGAVPSKIFDLMPLGVPALFCGGGEGARIIEEYGVGLTSPPADFEALIDNIKRLREMPDEEYQAMRRRCVEAAGGDFNFDRQMERYLGFLEEVNVAQAEKSVVKKRPNQIL